MKRLALRLALFGLIGMTVSPVFAAESVRYLAPGKSPVTLDEKVLAAMPRMTVQAGAHGDAPSAWEGVALVEVLRAQGAPLGKALRGDALANYVRVTATDGYQVVFSLGELDTDMGARRSFSSTGTRGSRSTTRMVRGGLSCRGISGRHGGFGMWCRSS
jgi:hypothetical protein